ncbi:hypothetical protein CQA57_07030 [Helicobacter anseris]|uniref:Uncharacterized protein n=2 Tax=Helicobacter anseris TaxID=375926 RepID=A0A3D8J4D4_9HELI|nr:hypothetical protein CQA57_07030 [Helicobacter anseris]
MKIYVKQMSVEDLEKLLNKEMMERAKHDSIIVDVLHEVNRRGLKLEWNNSELDRKYFYILS